MKTFQLSILIIILLCACQKPSANLGEAADFYPSSIQLREGIASKYYEHFIPTDKNKNSNTDISYRTVQSLQANQLIINNYDASMCLRWHTVYEIEDNQFKMMKQNYYSLVDTIEVEITNNIRYDWSGRAAISNYQMTSKNAYLSIFDNKQASIKDTILEDIPCKIIQHNSNYMVVSPSNDTINYPSVQKDIYAKRTGLFARYYQTKDRMIHSELIEQMSLSEFKKRANHDKKRMAYINPNKTMDDHSNFNLCNQEIAIGDYYNCDNRGQLIGGKGAWWRILKEELEEDKLKNESGYLTYRFVLNCKGETGRFITEESDLDFVKKKFNQETVKHLYEIVYKQEDWQTCTGERMGSQDAYTYITFKLNNGKIIEILP